MNAGPDPPLPDLLVAFRADLLAYVARHAGRLLQFESAEDLLQEIHLRAIEHGRDFRYRGREPFLAWMHTVARSHLADRHAYWNALRRRPARLLRLGTAVGDDATAAGTGKGHRGAGARVAAEPAATSTGPSTFASRREQIEIAVRALALLMPRDRDLVRWTSDGVPPDEQAARLGVAREAADRARRRALERFRKAFALTSGGLDA